jgi:2,5-dihydroxypyridine 5,6-dioxygenase
MFETHGLDLAKTGDMIVRQMMKIRKGEDFLVTVDSGADLRVAEAVANAARSVDARVALVYYPEPPEVGEGADPYLPEPVSAAIQNCDAWLSLERQYLLYSKPWQKTVKVGGRTRYLCLAGMDVEMLVRCIGRVDMAALAAFQTRLCGMTKNAKKMRITSPNGMDVSFQNDPRRPIDNHTGQADNANLPHMLPGQIGWEPVEESINGTLVFDGSIYPPIGTLRGPVSLEVKAAKIIEVKGGADATMFEAWLRKWNAPNMYNIVHICYGCNPGAKLTGNIVEDERVWGVTEWGIGFPPIGLGGKAGVAPSHTDGICLNQSIWMDGTQIEKDGEYVDPELAKLAKSLGK